MKHELSRRGFLRASSVAAVCGLAASRSVAEEEKLDGFEPLFNGRDLEGWHTNKGRIAHGTGGRWTVENGVITGEQDPPGSGNGGLLLTDREFSDFELVLEMNPDWGPDSGVFFRCTEDGSGWQMYVDYHDHGNVGHLRGEMPGAFAMMPFNFFGKLDSNGRLAALEMKPDSRAEKWPAGVYAYSCKPEEWLKVWRVGEWNTARIRCQGKYPQITTWVNGLKVCQFNGETCTLPQYDKDRVFGILGASGSIGLQVHGGDVWPKGTKCRWRNIRVREL